MKSLKDKYSKLRQRGLTLIEAAMVLAIATLVVAGIMIFFQSASINNKTNEAMAELNNLQSSVRSVYAGQSTYAGLTANNLIAARTVPSKMISGVGAAATLRHAFNGAATIAAASVPSGSLNNAFTITFSNIPQEACSKMGLFDLGNGLALSTINGDPIITDAIRQPSVTGVTGACDNANNNTMTWTFF